LSGEEVGKRRKREKKVKDPNAPKAPPSAYILFQNEIRNVVREANPTIQYRDLMGLISKQWGNLTPDKKQPYFDRVTAAKQTHEEELARYNALHANHLPSEGTSISSKVPRREVEPATKIEKKSVASVSKAMKVAPKSAQTVTSSEHDQSDGASDDVSSVDEKEAVKASDDGSSEEESAEEEPAPPPAKKAKKADKRK